MVDAFEGNKAETQTTLPTIRAFMTAHHLADVTIVAGERPDKRSATADTTRRSPYIARHPRSAERTRPQPAEVTYPAAKIGADVSQFGSASCTAASATTPNTANTPPGHTGTKINNPLDNFAPLGCLTRAKSSVRIRAWTSSAREGCCNG